MRWDKKDLDGEVEVEEMVECGNERIGEMKEKGGDVIVGVGDRGIEKRG